MDLANNIAGRIDKYWDKAQKLIRKEIDKIDDDIDREICAIDEEIKKELREMSDEIDISVKCHKKRIVKVVDGAKKI